MFWLRLCRARLLRTISCMVLSLIAIKVDNRKFQAAFAVFAVLCEITFIVTAQLTMA